MVVRVETAFCAGVSSLLFVVLSGGAVRAGAFRGARKLAVVLSGGTVRAVRFRRAP